MKRFMFAILSPLMLWLGTLGTSSFMPALMVRFEPGIEQQQRQVQVIALDASARSRIAGLMQQVRQDPLVWNVLEDAVSHLQASQIVHDVTTRRQRTRTRLPRQSYLVLSPGKRAAYMKIVDLKETTTVQLQKTDYLQGY